MSAWEVIVLVAIVGLGIFSIIYSIRKNKKKGGGCCGGNCSACAGCRAAKHENKNFDKAQTDKQN